ncbi:MAG: hypothetical protein HDR10_01825 [Lachnospiraceae bacterium]|nr:hypothetical protein [Lachnospiraceae bacterium]
MKNEKCHNQLHGEIEATYHASSLKMGISDSVSKILYAICSIGDTVKQAFPFSSLPSPLALLIKTEPPIPHKIARNTIIPYSGVITAKAAEPAAPSDCPTAIFFVQFPYITR